MSPPPHSEQHQMLRQRLQRQRQQIEHLLARPQYDDNVFPRSLTMRLLTRRPALAMRLALLLSPRLLRNLSAVLLLAQMLYRLKTSPPPRPEDTPRSA